MINKIINVVSSVMLSPADRNCSASRCCRYKTTKQLDPEQQHLRVTRCGAFTLIELLVVVLIIGILAAVALPQYEKAVEKSRIAEARIILRNIADAQQRYFMTNGTYAEDINDLDVQMPGEDDVLYGLSRKNTVYFQYGASAVSTSVMSGAIALANRLPIGTKYMLGIFPENPTQVYCYPMSTSNFCKRIIGGNEVTIYGRSMYLLKD